MKQPCVYIVGAGPGDPTLITVRGQRYLEAADVVVYDHRVHSRLLRAARADAERIDVGAPAPKPLEQDAICLLLAEKAREGKTVVRLKWGDPFVFDSGGKEALFLHEQGIPFEVVPGIPVTVGGPAYAGIPATYPGAGDVLALVRGNESESGAARPVDWGRLAGIGGTLVCYARARQITAATQALLANGRPKEETAALIYDATLPSQRTIEGTLGTIAASVDDSAPALLVVGAVVGSALAPALVRRPAALGTPHRRHPIERAGGRARRHAGGARRGGDSGARHPDRARQTIPPRSARRARRPGRTTGSSSRAATPSTTSCGSCWRRATSATCTA